METITILTLKGGQTKTTTALNLARALKQKGKRVLLIDLDYQQNLSILLEATNKLTAYDLLKSEDPKAILNQCIENDFIKGSEDLLELDQLNPNKLGSILELVKSKYDYTIIDNHCIVNSLSLNSLLASDKLIIPSTADRLGYIGVEDTTSLVNLVKMTYKKRLDSYLLLVKYNPKIELNSQYKGLLEDLIAAKQVKELNTIIKQSQPIQDSQALGLNLFEYSKRSNGARDYMTLADEIEGL